MEGGAKMRGDTEDVMGMVLGEERERRFVRDRAIASYR
jgi:hypothetical protein